MLSTAQLVGGRSSSLHAPLGLLERGLGLGTPRTASVENERKEALTRIAGVFRSLPSVERLARPRVGCVGGAVNDGHVDEDLANASVRVDEVQDGLGSGRAPLRDNLLFGNHVTL